MPDVFDLSSLTNKGTAWAEAWTIRTAVDGVVRVTTLDKILDKVDIEGAHKGMGQSEFVLSCIAALKKITSADGIEAYYNGKLLFKV